MNAEVAVYEPEQEYNVVNTSNTNINNSRLNNEIYKTDKSKKNNVYWKKENCHKQEMQERKIEKISDNKK